MVDINREQLIQWYCEEKLGSVLIGRMVGCSSTTILNRLKEFNIPKQPMAGRVLQYECSEALCQARAERMLKNNPNKGKRPHGKGIWAVDHEGSKYYFRSRWEILFADWLCKQGKSWQYESKTFFLSNGKSYTPDFLSDGIFYEIKGYMSPQDADKISLFLKEYQNEKLSVLYREDLLKLGVTISRRSFTVEFLTLSDNYKECLNCGIKFIPERKANIYCSGACSAIASGIKRRVPRIAVKCLICHKNLEVYPSDNRKTCGSYECRYKQSWLTRKENQCAL